MTARTPVIVDNCDNTIMAPMPQEKPVTTGCGTFWIWRPRRSSEKAIMKMEATMQTLAAPPSSLQLHGVCDERHGGAGCSADEDGISDRGGR